ncbi:MAG TPA: xanthine dehydrogenase family protein subunit M [Acidimicrobiales bacterium]|nr:xanthine dehydrogenase family protein subunit M [Acidimicrobiales bacterium]
MKPASFRYHAPDRLDDAVSVLAACGDTAKVIAGGQSLVPMMNLRLVAIGDLVDLSRVPGLDIIERRDGVVRVGATVRQSTAEHSDAVACVPLVQRALPLIGHFQIRNRGTIGGSLAHADPSSELPAIALALDAVVEATGPSGTRRIAAAELFESTWQTSLRDDEILTRVEFPVWSGSCGFAIDEVARRHGDFAIVGAAAGVQLDDGRIARATVALFGVGATAVRAHDAEAALVDAGPDADLDEIGQLATRDLDPPDDVHATGTYRREVAAVLVRRVLARAIEEARP